MLPGVIRQQHGLGAAAPIVIFCDELPQLRPSRIDLGYISGQVWGKFTYEIGFRVVAIVDGLQDARSFIV